MVRRTHPTEKCADQKDRRAVPALHFCLVSKTGHISSNSTLPSTIVLTGRPFKVQPWKGQLGLRKSLTPQRFPLSPNGGEGWGEGEFCLQFAKIAKIAVRTASVSCKTSLFQNLKTRYPILFK